MKVRVKKCPNGSTINNNTMIQAHAPMPQRDSNVFNILDGGMVLPISFNPIDGGTQQSIGRSHENGGMNIDTTGNGQPNVQIEGNETVHQALNGSTIIGGNMINPITKVKFKQDFKNIAKQENKATKLMDKATVLLDTKDPNNRFQALGFNSAQVLQDASTQHYQSAASEKQALSNLQESLLTLADSQGIDPQKLNKSFWRGGSKMKKGGMVKAKGGTTIEASPYIQSTAKKYGINPDVLTNLIQTESGSQVGNTSSTGAQGIVQFMPKTAQQYGVRDILNSTKPEDVARVIDAGGQHLASLLKANNNDYSLALAAYNGGQKSVNFVKQQLGKDAISGEDWMNFMNNRNQSHPTKDPNAWQNQTYNYVNTILKNPSNAEGFRNTYYNPVTEDNNVPKFIPPMDLSKETMPYVNSSTPVSPVDYGTPPNIQPATPVSYRQQDPKQFNKHNYEVPIGQLLPDLALAFQKPDVVPHQRYQPELYTPYQVSFQDKLNENNSTFNNVASQLTNNPEALSVLAGQKYNQDNSILGEQFRTNQGIQNDVTNKNVSILNDAQLKNLQLQDTQSVREAQAKSNTKAQQFQAFADIADKYSANRRNNQQLDFAQMLSGFDYDPRTGQLLHTGEDVQFTPGNGIPSTPVGNATKYTVKNTPKGSTTTTEYKPEEAAQKKSKLFSGLFRR